MHQSPSLRLELWGNCRRGPAILMLWWLIYNSIPAHKEFRFLLPALQLFIPYCGLGLAHACARAQQHPTRVRKMLASECKHEDRGWWNSWGIFHDAPQKKEKLPGTLSGFLDLNLRTFLLAGVFGLQLACGLYFCLFHQRCATNIHVVSSTALSCDMCWSMRLHHIGVSIMIFHKYNYYGCW
jgi:hypothetical protein